MVITIRVRSKYSYGPKHLDHVYNYWGMSWNKYYKSIYIFIIGTPGTDGKNGLDGKDGKFINICFSSFFKKIN